MRVKVEFTLDMSREDADDFMWYFDRPDLCIGEYTHQELKDRLASLARLAVENDISGCLIELGEERLELEMMDEAS